MNPDILDKIKKCLRLAKSSNPHEAATALRQAQTLMKKHGISMDDVVISDVDARLTPSGAGKTPPSHIAILVDMVCQAFGAQAIYTQLLDRKSWTMKGYLEFIGINGAASISAYAYEVLLRQLKRARSEYIKSLNKRLKQSTKVRRADIFCQGWVLAVSEQITPHQNTKAEKNALTKYIDNRWSDKLKSKAPLDRTGKARNHDYSAFDSGVSEGKKVQFHQGVNGRKQAAIGNG
ncbi:Protein of unknown function (DUF2786) [Methylophaga frappieri]|uniref:Uncharacterized protein n=1 Tax=Methylophaga frappieri (strain ATCC BAA-2434 / DSM 25690 / JAM7) TaxID=754477 RepID=I1YGD4_METFJ|nr:DUF2786 domain-containing protein [Methylophaga frappieri]AFJ01977.1 Protein of unknown function (DUF2786) [Methylophaga frappieri]